MSEPIQIYLNPFKTTGTGTWFKFAKMFKIKKLCGKLSSRRKKRKKLCYEEKFSTFACLFRQTYKDPVRIRPKHLVIRYN